MHRKLRLARILSATLVYSLVVLPLVWAERAVELEVRFSVSNAGLVVVPVQVNGHGPFRFAVDTGSSHTSIAAELAHELGSSRVAKTLVSTAAGEEWAAVTLVERVSVGPITSTAVLATETSASSIGDDGVLGVIGRDILEQRPFTIDYRRNVLSWDIRTRGLEDLSLPLDASGPVWRVTVRSSGARHLMVPDSGTTGIVLFDRGQWSGLRYQGGTSRVDTVTNVVNGRQGELRRMNIGTVTLTNQGVVIIDGGQVPETHGDGLLPLQAFARVTFDPPRGRVLLTRNETDGE